MLPGDDQLEKLERVVGPLRFELELPDKAEEYFAVTGTVASIPDDQRRYVRTHMRVVAALQYRRSLPALPRPAEWHKVIMRDISRSGTSFLHSEQVYPGEQLMLVLPDCKPRGVEVMRCRRIADRCFEVGVNFVQRLRSSSSQEGD